MLGTCLFCSYLISLIPTVCFIDDYMKNVLICGAGMSATDLISYMLTHAEEYNWEVTVGDISIETAKNENWWSSMGESGIL